MNAIRNKQVMQEIFEKVAQGDGSLFVAHLADDVTMTVTGQYSWSQTFTGKNDVLDKLFGVVRARTRAPLKTIPQRFIAEDDWVVIEARGDMTTVAGERYDNHYCLLYRLRDEKIVEIREYQDSTLCERVLGPYAAPTTSA